MFEHLARNWGNWASVAGLVFSILAFVFSKRASKAAAEARDAALGRSLGEDMNHANRTASDIMRFVRLDRTDMALLLVEELRNETSRLIARWDTRLPQQSTINLRTVRNTLKSIDRVLTQKSITELTSGERLRLVESCQQVNLMFSEEHGASMKATDRSTTESL